MRVFNRNASGYYGPMAGASLARTANKEKVKRRQAKHIQHVEKSVEKSVNKQFSNTTPTVIPLLAGE